MNVCNQTSVMIRQLAPIHMVHTCVLVTKATQAMETIVQVLQIIAKLCYVV